MSGESVTSNAIVLESIWEKFEKTVWMIAHCKWPSSRTPHIYIFLIYWGRDLFLFTATSMWSFVCNTKQYARTKFPIFLDIRRTQRFLEQQVRRKVSPATYEYWPSSGVSFGIVGGEKWNIGISFDVTHTITVSCWIFAANRGWIPIIGAVSD